MARNAHANFQSYEFTAQQGNAKKTRGRQKEKKKKEKRQYKMKQSEKKKFVKPKHASMIFLFLWFYLDFLNSYCDIYARIFCRCCCWRNGTFCFHAYINIKHRAWVFRKWTAEIHEQTQGLATPNDSKWKAYILCV